MNIGFPLFWSTWRWGWGTDLAGPHWPRTSSSGHVSSWPTHSEFPVNFKFLSGYRDGHRVSAEHVGIKLSGASSSVTLPDCHGSGTASQATTQSQTRQAEPCSQPNMWLACRAAADRAPGVPFGTAHRLRASSDARSPWHVFATKKHTGAAPEAILQTKTFVVLWLFKFWKFRFL